MNPKILELIKLGAVRTQEARLRWHRLDDDLYYTTIGPGMLQIGRTELPRWDEDGNNQGQHHYFELWVMTPSGSTLEKVKFTKGIAGYSDANELFREARRSSAAVGGVDTVHTMITALLKL